MIQMIILLFSSNFVFWILKKKQEFLHPKRLKIIYFIHIKKYNQIRPTFKRFFRIIQCQSKLQRDSSLESIQFIHTDNNRLIYN
jgi:hypothetical protein